MTKFTMYNCETMLSTIRKLERLSQIFDHNDLQNELQHQNE